MFYFSRQQRKGIRGSSLLKISTPRISSYVNAWFTSNCFWNTSVSALLSRSTGSHLLYPRITNLQRFQTTVHCHLLFEIIATIAPIFCKFGSWRPVPEYRPPWHFHAGNSLYGKTGPVFELLLSLILSLPVPHRRRFLHGIFNSYMEFKIRTGIFMDFLSWGTATRWPVFTLSYHLSDLHRTQAGSIIFND